LVKQRLIDRALELDLDEGEDFNTRSVVGGELAATVAAAPPSASTQSRLPDKDVEVLTGLRSGNSRCVLAALQEIDRLSSVLAAQFVSLLAWV
jgi:hypothetical protein